MTQNKNSWNPSRHNNGRSNKRAATASRSCKSVLYLKVKCKAIGDQKQWASVLSSTEPETIKKTDSLPLKRVER